MADLQKALATQLANIEKRTGRSLEELAAILRASGRTKHGELRDFLKQELGMGHGDANTLVHHVLGQAAASAGTGGESQADVLEGIYTGPKAALRPVHEALIREADKLGPYEVAPKKGYVSLRRKKQFATVGPATRDRVELGLNMKGAAATDRLVEVPPGGMCSHKVRLATVDEVDAEVIGWLRRAFEGAG